MNEGTTFLPLEWKLGTGGPVQFINNRDKLCLRSDQAGYNYTKVEKDSLIDAEKMKQEKEAHWLDRKNDSEEPYFFQPMIINNFEKINISIITLQMEQ